MFFSIHDIGFGGRGGGGRGAGTLIRLCFFLQPNISNVYVKSGGTLQAIKYTT